MNKKIFTLILIIFVNISTSYAQLLRPTKWAVSASKNTLKVGEVIELIFKVEIDNDWFINSSKLKVEGPLPTHIRITNDGGIELMGELIPISPKEKYEELWGGKLHYFEKTGKFIQKVKIIKANPIISGIIISQASNVKNNKCVPSKEGFNVSIKTIGYIETKKISSNKRKSSKYITGRRGGCFYINSSGNKVYVDRSLCN
jgi:hypothetical protein